MDDLRSPDEVAPLLKISHSNIIWSANGVLNGNSITGVISNSSIAGTVGAAVIFKAPAKAPQQNPVAVTAEVDTRFKYHGKTFDKTTLIGNITIAADRYLLEIREEQNFIQKGIWVVDSVSMVVDLIDDKVLVSDIRNFDPTVGSVTSWTSDGCTFTYLSQPIGDINITSVTGEITTGPDKRTLLLNYTHSGTVSIGYRSACPIASGLLVVDTNGEPIQGNPQQNVFDLSQDVSHDDNLYLADYKTYAKLSVIK